MQIFNDDPPLLRIAPPRLAGQRHYESRPARAAPKRHYMVDHMREPIS
jgi:hypothetical protein